MNGSPKVHNKTFPFRAQLIKRRAKKATKASVGLLSMQSRPICSNKLNEM